METLVKWHVTALVVGSLLTRIASAYMEHVRGCSAIGGEAFIIPLLMVLVELAWDIKEEIFEEYMEDE